MVRQVYAAPHKPVEAFGLTFPNPIGLAAGYDKDGLGWRGLACLGFGHIEIGTVTPKPQPGNLKPRLFRLPDDLALINRMGFPGKGAEFVLRQITRPRPDGVILGVNLGKNKDTPLEEGANDYTELFQLFARLADYLVVNVSSPNTLGLRRLQARQALTGLLGGLAQQRREEAIAVPVLVKLAPDLSDEELEDALDAIISTGMDGVVATNTTIDRQGTRSQLASEAVGMSGAPSCQHAHPVLAGLLPYPNVLPSIEFYTESISARVLLLQRGNEMLSHLAATSNRLRGRRP